MDQFINDVREVAKAYQAEEFPSDYRDFLTGDYIALQEFSTECLKKIYTSGRLSGTRLLDFGCGPTVHNISSASRQFKEIVLAEYTEVNRRELKKWLGKEKDALDWKPLLEQCARAESYCNLEAGVKEIEERIRHAVKKIVPCDALSKNILPEDLGEFDVVFSSYCLEGCCFTKEIYKEAIKKLAQYVRKGGAIVMVSVLDGGTYEFREMTLPAFPVPEELIKESLADAGLEMQDFFCWKDTRKHEKFQHGGVAVYYATKY